MIVNLHTLTAALFEFRFLDGNIPVSARFEKSAIDLMLFVSYDRDYVGESSTASAALRRVCISRLVS
jgi:hypothetical protein